jgi:hypothetical protein
MRRFGLALLIFLLLPTAVSSADWRWAPLKFKKHHVTYACSDLHCLKRTYLRERHILARRIERYNKLKLREWKHWTSLAIPDCTWYGESGTGPKYAPVRYTTPNSGGSGAYGKYQLMPGTYASDAKYGDWSPLDQEIAARREYWKHGTSPWTNCTG